EVLCGLTPEELALLLDVKGRLDAVGPEERCLRSAGRGQGPVAPRGRITVWSRGR
ncbi:aroma-sacti cluster domain-containing protein, partial [Streptomyces griseus]